MFLLYIVYIMMKIWIYLFFMFIKLLELNLFILKFLVNSLVGGFLGGRGFFIFFKNLFVLFVIFFLLSLWIVLIKVFIK